MALARVEQLNLGLSAGAVAASYVFATPHFASSVAAGAFLEAINLGAIYRAARRLFAGEILTNGWVGMLTLRFIILAAAIYVTMRMGAHPVALLIGLSIAMPSTLLDAWMNRPPIIDPAELPTFLEEFDEDDAEDPDRPGERLWSTGHLLTSRPLEYEDLDDSGERPMNANDDSNADESTR
jgi:hypothetical protein